MPLFSKKQPHKNTVIDHLRQAVTEQDYRSLLGRIQQKKYNPRETDSKGRTILHWAAILGKCDLVELLLQEDVEILATDWLGKSAVHYAILYENVHMVQVFLKSKDFKEEELHDTSGRGLLHSALDARSSAMIELCSKSGLFHSRDNYGRIPLHYASINDQKAVAGYLFHKTGNTRFRDGKGQTALHYAARVGSVGMLKELIKHGAAVKIKDDYGHTAIHAAIKNGHNLPTMMLLGNYTGTLKEAGPKFEEYGPEFEKDGIQLQRADYTTLIGQNISDIDAVDEGGDTLLHLAMKFGDENLVDLVLGLLRNNKPASMRIKNMEGNTPLDILVSGMTANVPIANAVLRYLMDTTGLAQKIPDDKRGWTPLHYAAVCGDAVMARLLQTKSEEVCVAADIPDTGSEVPLSIAVSKLNGFMVVAILQSFWDCGKMAWSYPKGRILLHDAAASGIPYILAAVLQHLDRTGHSTDMNTQDSMQRTPLHYAAKNSTAVMVELLLRRVEQAGGSADMTIQDIAQQTALHCAAAKSDARTMELLLQHLEQTGKSLDVGIRDEEGMTVLHRAAVKPGGGTLELLLGHVKRAGGGVDVTVQDLRVRTLVHCAAGCADEATMEVLLRHLEQVQGRGIAAMMMQDRFRCTPLHSALQNNDLGVAARLMRFLAETKTEEATACLTMVDWRDRAPLDMVRSDDERKLLLEAISASRCVQKEADDLPESSGIKTEEC